MAAYTDPYATSGAQPVQSSVGTHYRRTLIGFVLFEFLWGLGAPFAFYEAMVPAYMTVIGSSKALIGFALSFFNIAAPFQILSGYYFSQRNRVRNVTVLLVVCVACWFAYNAFVLAVGRSIPPGILQFGFLISVFGFAFFMMLANPLTVGIMVDNVPERKRGGFFGFRNLAFGAAGLIMAGVASRVLARIPSPTNYQVGFLIAHVFYFASAACFLFVRDDRPPQEERKPRLVAYVAAILRTLWNNPDYRIFIFFHILSACALAIGPFIVPHAKENMGMTDSQASQLAVLHMAVNALMGYFIGRIADRFGYKVVGIYQAILLIAFFAIAMQADSFIAVCVSYGLYALAFMAQLLILFNLSVELCPELDAADLAAVGRLLPLPFVVVLSPVCGTIVDLTHSYFSVFLIGMTLSVVVLLGRSLLMREPRTGKHYVVRVRPHH